MSNVESNAEQGAENVVELSDAEAAKVIKLNDYGVTSELTEANLQLLYSLYNDNVVIVEKFAEQAKAASSSTNDLKSVALTQVQSVERDTETLPKILDGILDQTFEYLDGTPEQAYHFAQGLSSILSYVNDIVKTSVERVAYDSKKAQGIDVTAPDLDDSVEDSKNICKAVRFTLTNLLNVAPLLGVEIPSSVKTKTGKAGNLLPDLKDLPKGRTAGSNMGRGAKARKVKYAWKSDGSENFQDLREGILLVEIATTVVSRGKYRISNADLQAMFGKDKVNMFSEEPWEITFPTGTLRGYLPAEQEG